MAYRAIRAAVRPDNCEQAMANHNVDGYVDLFFNQDRTQVTANIYPPKGAGRNLTTREVVERLKRMGVGYGYRETEIGQAIRRVAETALPVTDIVAAQGVLPEDGQDGQVVWRVDAEALAKPLPRRTDGLPNYFAYEADRRVAAGQTLAIIMPRHHGSPGKTLTLPVREVAQRPGKEPGLILGGGVRIADDKQQCLAEADGFAELKNERLTVHAFTWLEEAVASAKLDLPGGLIALGDVRDGRVRARGPVAVQGCLEGGSLRAHGDVYVMRAVGCKIVAEGSVYVLGEMRGCDVITPQRVIALGAASIAGGAVSATQGVDAHELGDAQRTATLLTVGVDHFSAVRLKEIEEEIQACELNVSKISVALRPLTTVSLESLPEAKRHLVDKLLEQRRQLELRGRELHNEKRGMNMARTRTMAAVNVVGTAHPGVRVTIERASLVLSEGRSARTFRRSDDGLTVAEIVLGYERAA